MKKLFFLITVVSFAYCTTTVTPTPNPPKPTPDPEVDTCLFVYKSNHVNVVSNDELKYIDYGGFEIYKHQINFIWWSKDSRTISKVVPYKILSVDTIDLKTEHVVYTLDNPKTQFSVYQNPWENNGLYEADFIADINHPETYYNFELCTKTQEEIK